MFDKNNSYKSYKKSYKLESDNLDAQKHLSENTYLPKHGEGSKAILRTFTNAYFKKIFAKEHFVINPFPGLLSPPEVSFSYSRITSLFLVIILLLAKPAFAQTDKPSNVSLYAKAGSGDHYTLYSDGLAKENAYIGGFKSVQLDPLEENIYFYDTGLKIISKINLSSGKVSKVIGKPKSSTNTDFVAGSTFAEANLSKLKDFSFDKYGNVFILLHNTLGDPNASSKDSDPIILKASFKDSTIKQVVRVNDYFRYRNFDDRSCGFNLNGVSYDNDKYLYLYGFFNYPDINSSNSGNPHIGHAVLRYEPLANALEIYALSDNLAYSGLGGKISFSNSEYRDPWGNSYQSLNGLSFDKLGNLYLSRMYSVSQNYKQNYYPIINKNTLSTSSAPLFTGDGTGTSTDIGDGGQCTSSYVGAYGSKFIASDINGDVLIADSLNNRIRQVNKDGLINTIAGGGTDTLVFGQNKTAKSIALNSPGSLLVDKFNNLYIVEGSRILKATNLVTYVNQPIQIAKVANLSISKIAENGVVNPLGDISMPDIALDYSYAGDKIIEVIAQNIPDGTNVKLTTTNADGTISPDVPAAKLANGVASIPVKIEAGVSKVIKAETDPFIPAPGVYLSGTEPMIAPGTLPNEPTGTSPKRNEVNLTTKNASGTVTGNLVPSAGRFNFGNVQWRKYDQWKSTITLNSASDPDNSFSDATSIDFGPSNNPFYLDIPNSTGKVNFSVWLRSDTDTFQIPIGVGPACPDRNQNWYFNYGGWEGCNYSQQLSQNTRPSYYSYINASVTPTWQKFTVNSTYAEINNINKQLFIGGYNQTPNKKVYVWGARAEIAP